LPLVKTNQSRVWGLGLEQSLSSDTLFAMCMACDNICMLRWSVLEQALHLPWRIAFLCNPSYDTPLSDVPSKIVQPYSPGRRKCFLSHDEP
jgi:hypothetical protein